MKDRPRAPMLFDRTTHEPLAAPQPKRDSFEYEYARTRAHDAAQPSDVLTGVAETHALPSGLAEFVHESFRALVLNPKFSCVAAKSAIQRGSYHMGVYSELASTRATQALAHDLCAFVQAQDPLDAGFSTFVASFTGPAITDELHFEQLLWAQLQCLHEHDSERYPWDPSANSDPEDPEFGFSFAGRAFFIVGLHPTTSRWTRRFAWPTLVFNAHFQFEALKAKGKFKRMQEVIRSREQALQGSVNVMLSDFGERSEARQYSGRAVEPEWRCPFHAHPESAATD